MISSQITVQSIFGCIFHFNSKNLSLNSLHTLRPSDRHKNHPVWLYNYLNLFIDLSVKQHRVPFIGQVTSIRTIRTTNIRSGSNLFSCSPHFQNYKPYLPPFQNNLTPNLFQLTFSIRSKQFKYRIACLKILIFKPYKITVTDFLVFF